MGRSMDSFCTCLACMSLTDRRMNLRPSLVILLASVGLSVNATAYEPVDSMYKHLEVVEVTAKAPKLEVIPAQVLGGEELRKLNSNSVADALRYFSGVQVKDYGGVGGIKTVNIRSMGTNHTGVVYDGVELGNAQNGQIDLGQFSLDNMESLSLYNGQRSKILQPAKDFGSAGSLYMRTKSPEFKHGESYHLRANLKFGSFDLINPSINFEKRLSGHVNGSLSAEFLNSSGKYKFRYKRVTPSGETAYDTTATRHNGDICAFRVEANLFGTLKNGSWTFKAYNYNSNRGIPGAIVSNVWRRGERIRDNNAFAQGRYSGYFGKFSTLNNFKYAFYRTHYQNNDVQQIPVDNLYKQQEAYFSTANVYEFTDWLEASASYDFQWNTMTADMYGFAKPHRYSNFLSGAVAINFRRIKFQASALGTFIRDKVDGNPKIHHRRAFTPAVFVSILPLRNSASLNIRAFYKRSFRMPTFNDLYYADMGNSKLNPERVTQYNLGVVYSRSRRGFWSDFRISADAYYNHVKDKIVAYPKGTQFRWTMLNLGLVDIKGIDASLQLTINPVADLYMTLRGQYTFQNAIDVTNPSDSYYKDQIPYIPHHSGSVVFNATWRGWGLNYSWIYVGARYSQQENIRYNYVQPWYTSDLSLSKDFHLRKVACRALVEINNLLSQDYDVILNYPMPKRNFKVTLSVEI